MFRACILSLTAALVLFAPWSRSAELWAKPSPCESCHEQISPKLAEDFNRSKMASKLTCADCHGYLHEGAEDADLAELPTIATCRTCHKDQAGQYLDGKHALGLLAMETMPFTHMQPRAFVQGRKGCGGCHAMGVSDSDARGTDSRRYYKYGMDCQQCHTRHAFSKKEASEPEACLPCHMGFDHAQWEMWSTSKHGVTYLVNRASDAGNPERAPKCQTCHMPGGNHRVYSAWGFLAVRMHEDDPDWMADRVVILKALGVLDPEGNPLPRLEAVKRAKMVRLDRESFEEERARFVRVCEQCHSGNFTQENLKNADEMLREADRLFAEAIDTVGNLYRKGIIRPREGQQAWPDVLTFYDAGTEVEYVLYEMFMDHRMKTYQASFHANPDFATWYGYAKMRGDLAEIKRLSGKMILENQTEKR